MVSVRAEREAEMEPLVPMTEIVTSATAQMLAASSRVLSASQTWPDPATGFAFMTCTLSGVDVPAFMSEPLRQTSALSLRRTPELAAYGFAASRCDERTRSEWLDGLAHLRGREILTADRQSFVSSPLEVLGIASGIVGFECPQENRAWYAETLGRAILEGHLSGAVSRLAASVALEQMKSGSGAAAGAQIDLAALRTPDLITVIAIQLCYQTDALPSVGTLAEALLRRCLESPVPINDALEAVVLSVVARRIAERAAVTEAADPVEYIVNLCRRFSLFARQMQSRQRSRAPMTIEDEYDVQDMLHAILRLSFDDVRAEEHTPSYASNSSRLDFYLPPQRIVVEAKMTRKGLGQRKVVDELLIDVGRYGSMPKVDTLICVIYDPLGECRNPAAIENDIENSGSRLKVRVVVCPRGM